MCTSDFVSKKRRCSGCLVSIYCSEKCQRAAWRNGHKTWCQALRCTVGESLSVLISCFSIESPSGPWGSRDIRKSLQVIAGFETSEISGMAKDIETRVGEAQRQFPAFKDRLVLVLDMTVYPPEVRVLPVHKLKHFPGNDPIWTKIADDIRARSDSPPKGYMFPVVKVHLGNRKFTLFSPSTALRMAFEGQYFSDDEEADYSSDEDAMEKVIEMFREHQDKTLLNATDTSDDECY
jgi:hypothetical protein